MKKSLVSLLILGTFYSNANAGIPVIDGTANVAAAAGRALDEALNQAMQQFNKMLEEASLTEGITTGNASVKGQQAYDAALKNASEFGGAYGNDAKNIMTSCFDISLPSFSAGLGIKGLDMCGLDSLDNMRKTAMKGKSTSFDQQTLDRFKEKMGITPGTKTIAKPRGSSIGDCIPGVGADAKTCKEMNEKVAAKEARQGLSDGGVASNAGVASVAKAISKGKATEKDENNIAKNEACSQNEMQGPTTKDLACTATTVSAIENADKEMAEISSESSRLTNVDPKNVEETMLKTINKRKTDATDRVNAHIDVRDEYNKKFNPSKFAVTDPESLGTNSTYKRLESRNQLNLEPTMYLVPQFKDEKFTFGKYGIDNYKDAINDFNNITLTDPEGNVKAGGDTESVKKTVDRLGGITPFSSALYGYEGMVSVMAKDIYSNGQENGEVGRQMAIIDGLKGNMFQTLLLNQQLENQARTDYNIRIKEFDKISYDNDLMNNNLELIQNQNGMIIQLLTELNNNIQKLRQ